MLVVTAGELSPLRLAALAQYNGKRCNRDFVATMIWLLGVGPFLIVHLPITLLPEPSHQESDLDFLATGATIYLDAGNGLSQ